MTATTDDRIRLVDLARGARPLLKRPREVARGYKLMRVSDLDRRLSIGAMAERNARMHPEAPAIKYRDRRITHAELNSQANRIARYLADRGIGAGDVVAVLIDNRPELIISITAIVKLGAIASVQNTKVRGQALAHCLRATPPKLTIVGEEMVEAFDAVRAGVDAGDEARCLYVADDSDQPAPPGYRDLDREIAGYPDLNPSTTSEVRLRDPCFYIFTSGTTGLPKASIMSHCRWIKAMGGFGYMTLGLKPYETLYVPLPFYHNTALSVGWSACAANGAALAMARRFSASQFWEDVRRHDARGFVYIGELCRYLLNQPPSPDERNHRVDVVLGNGLRTDIWHEFKRRFGIRLVYELYGASEANIAFFNLFNQDRTVGLCPATYALVDYDPATGEARRDANGRLIPVESGGTGLLIGKLTPDYPFDGYTDPEASEAKLLRDAFEPGDVWFNTGDLMRDMGYRHCAFVDRLGDTFRWRGENVSTTEVENVAMTANAVAEAVVYGVKVPGAEGRAGMAALRPAEGADAETAVLQAAERLHESLPDYAVPVFLRVVEQVETTGTFKYMKSELRDEGYAIERSSDPVYLRLPGERDYRRLTPELYARLQAGELGY